jgi:hypothetical protein
MGLRKIIKWPHIIVRIGNMDNIGIISFNNGMMHGKNAGFGGGSGGLHNPAQNSIFQDLRPGTQQMLYN